ncbi:DNA starvation/stationary phase protection protein [Miniimonas arenae]|uniref:DNA starvation/stationary phase protection protein n=1 Tax=Miniimonas arenae TaxID=676201 RepID=A0A5C5BBA8_9MICO|nr:DNA starvation/stationary phase protection protein [Miniimonas arenae]TNU74803.1 DNA starvation/stationary phase protection protein [Miniimonas arenae]
MSTPEIVTSSLQQALVDLIDLSLQAKQAHWNVCGPQFRSVHLQLDDVVADVRTWSDDVAERLVAIGGTPDGRAATVAAESAVEQYESGAVASDKVIQQFAERLSATAERIKEELPELEVDLPSQDLLIGVAFGLEKHAWMFRASH